MVLLEDRRHHVICRFRVRIHSPGELASLRSQWLAGNSDRRLDHFFHIHRIRFRFDGGGGMQKSAARSADRNYRHAGNLHGALYRAWSSCSPGSFPGKRLLDDAAPVVNTMKRLHFGNDELVVLIGALMGMISSLLVFQLGQARVWFAMSRDGLLPRHFQPRSSAISHAGFFHVGRGIRGRNSGGLAGYRHARRSVEYRHAVRICAGGAGVLILRYREPNRPRGFRVPGGPMAPIADDSHMLAADGRACRSSTGFDSSSWLVIGLFVYHFYGHKHSGLATRNGRSRIAAVKKEMP